MRKARAAAAASAARSSGEDDDLSSEDNAGRVDSHKAGRASRAESKIEIRRAKNRQGSGVLRVFVALNEV